MDSVHAAEVNRALEVLKEIYRPAGSLHRDAAKTRITQRRKATVDLVEHLAKFGPGCALALAGNIPPPTLTRDQEWNGMTDAECREFADAFQLSD
ncbi:MAG TPA: hypothetical protein VNO52_15320 [Methylomirabilota bacterium]|nr:hypothetical protein [Methylomirabilota bacterium]